MVFINTPIHSEIFGIRSFFSTTSSFPFNSFKITPLLTIIDEFVELTLFDLLKDNLDTELSYGYTTICGIPRRANFDSYIG
jgi:hypothetical protein